MNQLQQAIKARDQFLKDNPHMLDFQKEIDEIMLKVKTEERYDVILLMLAGRLEKQMGLLFNLKKLLDVNENAKLTKT